MLVETQNNQKNILFCIKFHKNFQMPYNYTIDTWACVVLLYAHQHTVQYIQYSRESSF